MEFSQVFACSPLGSYLHLRLQIRIGNSSLVYLRRCISPLKGGGGGEENRERSRPSATATLAALLTAKREA